MKITEELMNYRPIRRLVKELGMVGAVRDQSLWLARSDPPGDSGDAGARRRPHRAMLLDPRHRALSLARRLYPRNLRWKACH